MTTMRRRRMKRRRILSERRPPLILSSHLPLTVTRPSSDQDVAAPPFVALADHHGLPCCSLRPVTEQRLRASTLPLPLTWCFVSFCDQRCCPSFLFFLFCFVSSLSWLLFFFPSSIFSVLFSPFHRSGVITLNLRGGSKVTESSRDVFASRTALFSKDSCKHFVHSGDQTTITLCDWEGGRGGVDPK